MLLALIEEDRSAWLEKVGDHVVFLAECPVVLAEMVHGLGEELEMAVILVGRYSWWFIGGVGAGAR